MSKHHPDRSKHWREIMEQGRRRQPAGMPTTAGAGAGGKAARGAGAPPARPQPPLRRPRPGKPPSAAAASGAASAPADATPATHAPARAPQLDGLGLPYITLAQLLKKLSLVGSGGEAKAMVRAGGIRVNGVDETRPGRKLHQGDKVTISGHDHHVNLASG